MCVCLKAHFTSHLVNKANPGKFALPCKVLPHDQIIISDGKETMASLIHLMCGHDPRSIVQHHQGQKPQCKDTCPSFPKGSTSLAAPLPLEVWGIWDWAGILFFFFLVSHFFKFIFYWRIIAIQNFVVFCWTSTWISHQFSSVQSFSRVWLFATPWITARQASLSITNSWSLPKLTSIESVMPSSHLILCHPLLLLPNIRVFSSEPALHMRWPKYWEFQPHNQSFQWTHRTDLL